MAVLFLRTIVWIVALSMFTVIPAPAQSGPTRTEVTARTDENCVRKPAEFLIPVGYFAEKFSLVSLSAGRSCGPNREALTHRGFQIRSVSSAGAESPVFNYGKDDGRSPVEDAPGLAALTLPAGRYRLYVDGARDNSVVISYLVSAGDAQPPGPAKAGPEKSVRVQPASDGRVTARSFSDERCTRTVALFTVPAGKIAGNFQLASLTSGRNCGTGMELAEKGFQILALVGSAPEALRFNYNQSGSRPPSQTPVGLAQLQLPPGTYKVRVNGARSNEVILRFVIKDGYAEGEHTENQPPPPAKTIVCPNDGKNFTAHSFANDQCVLTACSFTVPPNQLAVQFKVQSLTPGSGCGTGMPSNTAGFRIVRSGTLQVLYNYTGPVTQNPAGLSELNLRPGNYLLQTSVARNSGVRLTFMVENPFEAAPETPRVGASATPGATVPDIAGTWDTTIPGTVSVVLEFQRSGSGWSGRFWGRKGWEAMADLRFDPASGELSFRRPLKDWGEPDQLYTARVTGNSMSGKMDNQAGWTGTRRGGTSTKAGSSDQPKPSALVNLARGKSAMQSSTGYGGTADRAVDGNTNGDYFAGRSVTHTEEDNRPQPWWQVDLGVSSQIDHVILWNRSDCCGERLSAFWVFVSDAPFPAGDAAALLRDGRIWHYEFSGVAGPQSRIAVGRQGRYVRVQLSGRAPLSLAEVEVFGR